MPATRGRRTSAATAVPANPLQAHRLAFSGKFPGFSHKDLNTLFTSLGASVTPSVNGRNTHLVCDEKDFLKKAPKVRDAEAAGVSLVKPEWVAEVAKLRTNVDPSNYLWPEEQHDQGDHETPGDCSADGRSKKRPIAVAKPNGSDRDAGADDGHVAKKPRGKAAQVKDEEEEEREEVVDQGDLVKEETIETKLKELSKGQFLKKDIVIPVDERCPLQAYAVYVEPRSGMIYDASLNQSSTSNNHNKFYRLQVSGPVFPFATFHYHFSQSKILTPTDLVSRLDLQNLDSMGPCWRDGTECHSRGRLPR